MRRTLATVLVTALLFSLVGGCASNAGVQGVRGVFSGYETRQSSFKFPASHGPGRSNSTTYQYTGRAFVTLQDGHKIVATCPFPALTAGKSQVVAKQAADGSWIVMSRVAR